MTETITSREGSWHGIGHQIKAGDHIPTALRKANLNWDVESRPLYVGENVYEWDQDGAAPSSRPTDTLLKTHVANVRSDTQRVLGVVGSNYQILQNDELAALVEAVEQGSKAEIESAMELRDGRDVFFLMKNSAFELPGEDEVHTYHLFGNNHAGERSLNILPTSVRIVCENTLNMALYKGRDISLKIKHTPSMKEKIEEAIMVMKRSEELATAFEQQCRYLTTLRCQKTDLNDYFNDVYTTAYGALPEWQEDDSEYTKGEASKITRHDDMISQWTSNFAQEAEEYGDNYWVALNAVTKWIDHSRTVRGATSDPSLRIHTNLLGSAATMKETAFRLAMETV